MKLYASIQKQFKKTKMKKILLFVPLIVLTFSTTSCSDTKEYEAYTCPMECEGTKTYDKPGTCPVCEMDLEGVEKK